MSFKKSHLTLGTILAISLICFFCGSITEPNFDPPKIINDTIIGKGSRLMGTSYFMYVNVTEVSNVTYQWLKNDTVIEGKNTDTLKFDTLSMNHSGIYKFYASNPMASDTSKAFDFKVIYVDKKKPEIMLISPNDSSFTADTTIIIRFSVLDKSDIAIVSVNGYSIAAKDTTNDTLFYECSIPILKDTNNISIIAEDALKFIDTLDMVLYFDKTFGDHKKPSIRLLSPVDSAIVKDSILIISYKILDTSGISFVSINEKSLKLTDSIYTDTVILTKENNIIKTIAKDNSIHKNSDTLNTTIFYIKNKAPKWSKDTMEVFINEGEPYTLYLMDSCSDEDGDDLTFSLPDNFPETDQIKDSYYLYTPSFTDSGIHYVTITAFDAKKYSSVILKLIVNNVNRKPIFQDSLPDDFYEVKEGAKLSINFVAIDPDGDNVSYELIKNNLPGQTEFSNSQLVWQSTNNDSGYYSVSIRVTDGFLADTVSIIIAVGDVNRPPQISINTLNSEDTVKITEMKNLSFTVSATDPDSGNVVWLLPMKNTPTGATYNTTTGVFSYTPSFSISNGLYDSIFADLTFFATDSVNTIGNDSFVIHVRVVDSNSAPKWTQNTTTITGTEGTLIEFDFSQYFKGDNENDPILFSASMGKFNSDTTKWNWTPTFDDSGTTILTITASDSLGHTPPAKSTLSVTIHVGDTPQYNLNVTIQGSGSVTPKSGVYIAGTTFSINAKPDADWELSHWSGNSVSGNDNPLSITINTNMDITAHFQEINYPPEFVIPITDSSNISCYENQIKTLNITITDKNGTTPFVSINPNPDWLTISGSGNNYTLTTEPGFNVSSNSNPSLKESIIITLIDADETSITTTHKVNVEILNKNRKPEFIGQTPSDSTIQIGEYYSFKITVNDSDNDQLSFVLNNEPEGMSYDTTTKLITWLADRDKFKSQDSPYEITFSVYDGSGDLLEHSWKVSLSAHQWEKIGSDIPSINIAAKDSLTLFTGAFVGIKRTIDGCQNWSTFLQTSGSSAPYNSKIIGNHLYIESAAPFRPFVGYLNKIELSSATIIKKFTHNYSYSDFSFSKNGDNYFNIGAKHQGGGPNITYDYGYVHNGVFETRLDTKQLSDIVIANDAFVAFTHVESNSNIYRFVETKWDTILLASNSVYFSKESDLEIASNNGEILYISSPAQNKIHKITNATSSSLTITSKVLSFSPTKILMLNEHTGWIISSDGKLYSTNDSFSTVTKEIIPNNTEIKYIIKAADGYSIFAYNDDTLFRY